MRCLSTIVTGKTFYSPHVMFSGQQKGEMIFKDNTFFVSPPSTREVSHMGFAVFGKTYILEGNQRTCKL